MRVALACLVGLIVLAYAYPSQGSFHDGSGSDALTRPTSIATIRAARSMHYTQQLLRT
jgi:hypothetical protein